MAISKYIKQPMVGSNVARYTDGELRKLELSISSLIAAYSELEEMSTSFESGSFVATLTGCTTAPQVSVRYARAGKIVTLFIPALTATSNSTACTITGVPAALRPSIAQGLIPIAVYDNNVLGFGSALIDAAGSIILRPASFNVNGFTAANGKGVDVTNLTYLLEG